MAAFSGVDFLDFDSLLTDEEKLARQTARQFVDDQILPIIEEYNREGKFPKQLVPQLGELGFFGASLKGYGCAGMSNVEYGLVTQELERGDSGLRSFVSVQSALVMYPIHAFGSDAQKDKWLPLLQQGKAIGCFGLTEPQFGSNPGGMLTRAVRQGDSYILNGEKMWITSGSIADVAVDLGQGRRRHDPRFPGGKRHARIQGLGRARQMVAARFHHLGPGDDRLQNSRRKYCCRASTDSKGPLILPESSALRNRLGRDRRGDGLLRHRAALRQRTQAIRQQAHRLASTRPGKISLDDHRNHQSAIARPASGPPER